MSVVRTIISAFRASKTYIFSTEQYSVFIQYILAEMEHNSDDVITLLMKFLENNANVRCRIFDMILNIDLLFNYFLI